MKLNIKQFSAALLVLGLTFFWACTPKAGATAQEVEQKTEEVVEAALPEAVQTPPPPPPAPPKVKPKKGVKSIPMDERVKIGSLPNGLTYYIQKNAKPENRAEFRIALKAGSIVENEDERGLAHFIEHMCFNGTRNFEKSELIDFIEGAGLRFGADLNAYTSFDETVYMLPVRTDSMHLLNTGLDIIEDWSAYVTFEDEEIDKERGVVDSERTSRSGPQARMIEKLLPKLFKGSKYAERLPIGTPEIINGASYATVKNFYKKWYRPNLMAIICVGDFDPAMIEKEIIARFSKLENPAEEVKREKYEIPVQKESVISIITDKEANSTSASVYYRLPSEKTESIADMRKDIMQSLYSRMINGRLSEIAQSGTPPFINGYSYKGNLLGDALTYVSAANTAEGKVMEGLEAVLTENRRVVQHGFTATELDRAKENMILNLERGVKEQDKVDNRRLATRYSNHFLDGSPIPSPEQLLEIYSKFLRTIRVKDMDGLAQKWMNAGMGIAIAIDAPEPKAGEKMPTEAELLALLDAVSKKETTPYVDKVSDQPLYAKTPQPVAISNETKNEKLGVTSIQLANGVKVILKPTDFKNDEILMSAYSAGGNSLFSDEDYVTAKNATTIIDQSGIADFDNVTLTKMLTGKTVSCSPYISELEEGFTGSCSPDDFELMLQLVDLYFTAPRADEEAMKSFVTRMSAQLAQISQNPQYHFYGKMYEALTMGHVRGKIFDSPEDLAAMKLSKALEMYKDRFSDASDFTFVLVGNFDMENAKTMAAKYLGNLPSTGRKETWKDPNVTEFSGNMTKEFTKGIDDQAFVAVVYKGDFDWDVIKDRTAFYLTTEATAIKLREAMREDKGGVYGVGYRGQLSKEPKEDFGIQMNFTTKDSLVDLMISTAMEVLEKVQVEGVDAETLNKVKAQSIESHKKGMKENRFWRSMIKTYDQKGLDLNLIIEEDQAARINAVTNEDIIKMSKRLLSTPDKAVIIQRPEKK